MAIIEEDLKDLQFGNKSEHAETLEHLSNDLNFSKKTILSNYEQAYAFATLWSIAEENDITFLKKWLKNVADYYISIDGKGREDIVKVSMYKSAGSIGWTEKLLDKMTNR